MKSMNEKRWQIGNYKNHKSESTDFEDFLRQLSEQNIEIGKGNSKKYGEVIKYKLPDDTRCHLGYSLGRFYGDDAIQTVYRMLRNV